MKKRCTLISFALIFILSASCFLLGHVQLPKAEADNEVVTRTVELKETELDYESVFEQFDEAEFTTEGSLSSFTGKQTYNLEDFAELDELSQGEIPEEDKQVSVKYNFSYDSELNIVTVSAIMENGDTALVDELVGVGFINEDGELDAVLECEDEYILLSEMKDAGMIANCGWFSRLAKKIATAVAVVVVVSTVAAVVVASCGAGAGAVIAAGAIAGGVTGAVSGGVISHQETGKVSLVAVLCGAVGGAGLGALCGLFVTKAQAIAAAKKAIKNVELNRQNHILQSKHLWNKVCNGKWSGVKNVIQKVLTSGNVAAYGGGAQIVTATVKGQTVQVVIKVINGVMRIVDAWVKF